MGVFGDINEVKVIGNITQDIEVKKTSNGNAVTNFGVATNRNYRVGEEWKEETTFHNIVVWGNDAGQLEQRAKKGTRVYIQGRLQTRKWEDKDGKTNYKTEVVADKIILLDRYERGQMSGGGNSGGNYSNQGNSDNSFGSSQEKSKTEDTINPDDLPF